MGATPARSKPTQPSSPGGAERLEALSMLRKRASARLDESVGFLAALDDDAISAHVASGEPETLGTWPNRKT